MWTPGAMKCPKGRRRPTSAPAPGRRQAAHRRIVGHWGRAHDCRASRSVLGQMTCQTPSAYGSVNANVSSPANKFGSPNQQRRMVLAGHRWPAQWHKSTVRFRQSFLTDCGDTLRRIRLLRDTTTQPVSEKYSLPLLEHPETPVASYAGSDADHDLSFVSGANVGTAPGTGTFHRRVQRRIGRRARLFSIYRTTARRVDEHCGTRFYVAIGCSPGTV